jgi:hypothetical protein
MTAPRRRLRRQAVGSATLMAILALTAVLTGLGRTASVKPDLLLTAGTNFTVTSSISSSPSTEVPALLFPGAVRYLSYTVHNPLTVPITVDSLSTSLDPEFQIPPICPAANLDLSGTGFTGSLTVPAGGVAQVSRPITLLNTNTNQDGCKSVTFHFVHAGTATYTQVFATTTTLTSAPNPSLLSQSVTFTATVTPAGTPPSGPTGTVNFELCPTTACSSPTLMGSAAVQANGQATFSTSTFAAGTYIVRATYLGDGATANFSGSTSNTVSQTVNKFGTTTALTSSLNPSTYGQAVTFTGTVTSPSGTPAGQVNFFDGLTPIGSSTLIGGQATLTTSSLIVGSHPITAVYAGSATHLSSTSPVVSQTVNYTSCVSTTIGGGLTVNAGQWVCITSSGRVNGDVIVKSGGTLAVLGGTVNGKLSEDAANLRGEREGRPHRLRHDHLPRDRPHRQRRQPCLCEERRHRQPQPDQQPGRVRGERQRHQQERHRDGQLRNRRDQGQLDQGLAQLLGQRAGAGQRRPTQHGQGIAQRPVLGSELLMGTPLASINTTAPRRASRAVIVRRLVAALVAGASLLVGLGAGAAYAYWRSSGAGSGTASVGNPAAVTVVAATATPATKLIPGNSADLVLRLNNPNAYPVTIIGITQSGSIDVVGGSGCSGATSGVTVPTQTGLSLPVASGTGMDIHVPGAASMSLTSASGCQGASFHIPLTVTVRR